MYELLSFHHSCRALQYCGCFWATLCYQKPPSPGDQHRHEAGQHRMDCAVSHSRQSQDRLRRLQPKMKPCLLIIVYCARCDCLYTSLVVDLLLSCVLYVILLTLSITAASLQLITRSNLFVLHDITCHLFIILLTITAPFLHCYSVLFSPYARLAITIILFMAYYGIIK